MPGDESIDAFYAWAKGKTYRLSEKKQQLAQAVKEVFWRHRRRYGARRIAAELRATGYGIGRRLAGSLLKKEGLTAIRPKRFVPRTTDSKHGLGFSANLLKTGLNDPTGKGEVIIGDITYLPQRGGKFCYAGNFSG